MPLLFAYGTLRLQEVQHATFGRALDGHADRLSRIEPALTEIDDPEVLAVSAARYHPMARYTGRLEDHVDGTAFEVTDDELALADRYEVSAYRRVAVRLDSGRAAWAYVAADAPPPDAVTPPPAAPP
ncbi:MAG: gamma-glutamylcyclotransferase family protein [Rubricoccaceae bacterium]|nr:gamma-glutamylcyclotransferase family protein [Rubricoccaceae bacterium]